MKQQMRLQIPSNKYTDDVATAVRVAAKDPALVVRKEGEGNDVLIFSERMLTLDEIALFAREARRVGSNKIQYSCPAEYYKQEPKIPVVERRTAVMERGERVEPARKTVHPQIPVVTPTPRQIESSLEKRVNTENPHSPVNFANPHAYMMTHLADLARVIHNNPLPSEYDTTKECNYVMRAKALRIPAADYSALQKLTNNDILAITKESYARINPKTAAKIDKLEEEAAAADIGINAIENAGIGKTLVNAATKPLKKKKESILVHIAKLRKDFDDHSRRTAELFADIAKYEKTMTGSNRQLEELKSMLGGSLPIYIVASNASVAVYFPSTSRDDPGIMQLSAITYLSSNGTTVNTSHLLNSGVLCTKYTIVDPAYSSAKKVTEYISAAMKNSSVAKALRRAAISFTVHIEDLCTPEDNTELIGSKNTAVTTHKSSKGTRSSQKSYSTDCEKVLSLIKGTPGIKPREIKEALPSLEGSRIRYLLKNMRDNSAVRVEGQTSNTMYFPT